MTLDMEVPLMPSFVGASHPLKMMVGMMNAPQRDPSPPKRTESRASSRGSPAQPQPAAPRTGFSIADILKPEFGSKGDDKDSSDEEELEVEQRDKQREDRNEHSVFKAEPLKDRLKLPIDHHISEKLPKGYSSHKFPVDSDLKVNGLMAPKPLHGLPSDLSPAYYQSYYSLCQQKYADYMQFYGQSRMLPFQLPTPTGQQPLKNHLQLAHEQLLTKHQLPPHQQTLPGRVAFPGAAPPSLYPPHVVHPAQASAYLPHGPHHGLDVLHQRSPLSHFSPQPSSPRDLDISSPCSIASSPSPVPRPRTLSNNTQRSVTPRTPDSKTPGCTTPRSPSLTSGKARSSQARPDSTSRDSGEPQDSPQEDGEKDDSLWPAWVYCTRYSDRPSSGPRSRKMKRKDKNPDEKRPRTAFTNDQLDFLRREFESNKYLTEERRQRLAKELSLTESQIKIWFQNKRAKLKKTSDGKNALAISLMAQGLYKHTSEKDDGSNCSGEVEMAD